MASAAEQLASNLNLGAFAKAEALKKRIWFTLGALLVYRLGTYIPLPGINPEARFTTDNAIMIAIAGFYRALQGPFADPEALQADGNLSLA